MKFIFIILATMFTSGCLMAGMPGDLTVAESKVEGTKELSVSPGWLPGSWIKMGVYRNTKMLPDEAILVLEVQSMTIMSKDGLTINIDGEKTNFSSIDALSDMHQGFFSKRFPVKLDYLKKIVAGKSVWVRINGNGSQYSEGEFSKDGLTTARPGFKKFLEKYNEGVR